MSDASVLITGANGGIGQALCAEFAAAGWQVIATDIHAAAQTPVDNYFALDLGRFATDDAFRESARELLVASVPEQLTCLVNNAAYQVVAPVSELQADDWQQSLSVNVTAPFLLVQALLDRLSEAQGNVINISSVHASLTKPDFVGYATSKAALEGLTRALAVEIGGSVRVNAIAPAAISTPMLEAGFEGDPGALAALVSYHPSGSIGSPGDVAKLALAVAEVGGSFLNGAIVGIDGGIASRLHDPV